MITLDSAPSGAVLDTDGIAWDADLDVKFAQVDGFVSAIVIDTSQSCEEVFGDTTYDGCSTYVDSLQYLQRDFLLLVPRRRQRAVSVRVLPRHRQPSRGRVFDLCK